MKPVALSASTSHASVAPEKNVNPSPSRIEAIAQPEKRRPDLPHDAGTAGSRRRSVAAPSRNENRRPRVSATTPVGTSNSTWPTVKNALAANACGVVEPGVEQEQRVDAPDERRRQGREQGQDQVGPLDRLRWGSP